MSLERIEDLTPDYKEELRQLSEEINDDSLPPAMPGLNNDRLQQELNDSNDVIKIEEGHLFTDRMTLEADLKDALTQVQDFLADDLDITEFEAVQRAAEKLHATDPSFSVEEWMLALGLPGTTPPPEPENFVLQTSANSPRNTLSSIPTSAPTTPPQNNSASSQPAPAPTPVSNVLTGNQVESAQARLEKLREDLTAAFQHEKPKVREKFGAAVDSVIADIEMNMLLEIGTEKYLILPKPAEFRARLLAELEGGRVDQIISFIPTTQESAAKEINWRTELFKLNLNSLYNSAADEIHLSQNLSAGRQLERLRQRKLAEKPINVNTPNPTPDQILQIEAELDRRIALKETIDTDDDPKLIAKYNRYVNDGGVDNYDTWRDQQNVGFGGFKGILRMLKKFIKMLTGGLFEDEEERLNEHVEKDEKLKQALRAAPEVGAGIDQRGAMMESILNLAGWQTSGIKIADFFDSAGEDQRESFLTENNLDLGQAKRFLSDLIGSPADSPLGVLRGRGLKYETLYKLWRFEKSNINGNPNTLQISGNAPDFVLKINGNEVGITDDAILLAVGTNGVAPPTTNEVAARASESFAGSGFRAFQRAKQQNQFQNELTFQNLINLGLATEKPVDVSQARYGNTQPEYKMSPILISLLKVPSSHWNGFEISAENLQAMQSRIENFDDSGHEEIDTGTEDNDYWTVENGELIAVKDGKNKDTGAEVNQGKEVKTFEVGVADSAWDEDFASIEAFFRWISENPNERVN